MWIVCLILLGCFSHSLCDEKSDRVNYQLMELDSEVMDIQWCGPNDEILLALTTKNHVYRSENNGFVWKKLTDILKREGKSQRIGKNEDIGKVMSLVKSPADKSLFAMIGSQGICWYTEDCGKSIYALNHGRPINEFQFHPTQRAWGLAAAWTNCDDFVKEPCQIYKELFLTKDTGQN